MSTAATLALIDMALGALEVATKVNLLLNTARAENRDVSDAEFAAIVAENKTKRDAWDEQTR